MKYEENQKSEKFIGSMGFYAIIALSLIAIGVIAWFAVTKNSENKKPMDDSSLPSESYNSSNESYNDISDTSPDNNTSEIVENPVSDVPYNENDGNASVSSEPQNIDFTLPTDGKIIKGFSDTVLQKSATYGDMRLHLGIDIECKEGANIKSVGSGTILSVEDTTDYGKCISIDYGNGITVKYCGMSTANYASGDKVRTGDILGVIGTVPCECADGFHLHLESYKDGVCVSPLSLLGLDD